MECWVWFEGRGNGGESGAEPAHPRLLCHPYHHRPRSGWWWWCWSWWGCWWWLWFCPIHAERAQIISGSKLMHDVGSARLHVQRWHLQTNMPPRSFHCQKYIWPRNKFLKVCVFVSIFFCTYISFLLNILYFRQLQQIWASNSWGGEQDIHQHRHRRGLCGLITVGIAPWVYPRYPCLIVTRGCRCFESTTKTTA